MTTLPSLSGSCPHIGRLSDTMRELQSSAPIRRVRTPAGDEGWLVTRHAELKQLLLDERIGRSHLDPDNMPRYLDSPLLDLTVQNDHRTARDIHARMRSLLTPHFTARRMAALRPLVAKRTNTTLDTIVDLGPPADLHSQLSVPVSFQVLCDLLGIAELDTFMVLLEAPTTVATEMAPQEFPLFGFLAELVAAKRAHPAEDLISTLCESDADDEEVVFLVATVAFSYLVTPHNISVGIALLASDPTQRDLVAANPDLLAPAVEEVLRLGKTTESLLPRYASEDVEIAGVTIQAGDLVLCDHYAPSFDDRVFHDPDRFDVTRSPNPHPAFSHGNWYCVGAPLARIELVEVYRALLSRLPGMRLEVPVSEIRCLDTDQFGGGIAELPITW
jgi:cytochrome P450 monooxygenase